jgi:hypothetical protein
MAKDVAVLDVEASPVEILEDETKRISVVLSKPEYEALANLLSVRFKPSEIEALERSFPHYAASELFAVAKLKQLARDEIVASEWRRNGGEWKNQATSYARQLASDSVDVRKYAQREIHNLADKIPADYHEATIKHVIVKLDKGSQDARVVELTTIFKNA